MSVTYTKEQREHARAKGMTLATVAVVGLEFQGPVTDAERDEILEFWMVFHKRRVVRLAAETATPPGPPPTPGSPSPERRISRKVGDW